jgi:hypothetical protein
MWLFKRKYCHLSNYNIGPIRANSCLVLTYVGNEASWHVEDESEDDDGRGEDQEVEDPAEVVPALVVVDGQRVVGGVGVEVRKLPEFCFQWAAVSGTK